MKAKSARMKELQELIRQAENYKRLKPVYDELNGIKWKNSGRNLKPPMTLICGCFIRPPDFEREAGQEAHHPGRMETGI